MSALTRLNALPAQEAQAAFLRCCGSTQWAEAMVRARPYASPEAVLARADAEWAKTTPTDWREAMGHHPRIGEQQLRERFKSTHEWSKQEQQGVSAATEDVLRGLAEGNRAYEERFGFIFLVCATGKSAEEMLSLLQQRMQNDVETELRVAAAEQGKITRIRLERLLSE